MALASDEGFPREGRLDFLDNQLDPATGTIRGRAIFRNADGELTPGLFVRLRLPGSGSYQRPADSGPRRRHRPRQALRATSSAPTTRSQYRAVTLGPIVDGLRVVRSGLKAGEPVVVNGLQRVRPGVQVEPVHVAMDRSVRRRRPQRRAEQ